MQKTSVTEGIPGFDWDAYAATERYSKRKGFNKQIKEKYPDSRVYSHEPYALELYEQMLGYEVHVKDYKEGDVVQATTLKADERLNGTGPMILLMICEKNGSFANYIV